MSPFALGPACAFEIHLSHAAWHLEWMYCAPLTVPGMESIRKTNGNVPPRQQKNQSSPTCTCCCCWTMSDKSYLIFPQKEDISLPSVPPSACSCRKFNIRPVPLNNTMHAKVFSKSSEHLGKVFSSSHLRRHRLCGNMIRQTLQGAVDDCRCCGTFRGKTSLSRSKGLSQKSWGEQWEIKTYNTHDWKSQPPLQ